MLLRFDWYQGTVPALPDQVLDACMTLAGASELEHDKGRLNYAASARVRTAERDVLATVLHGGNGGGCHVIGTGAAAPPLADLLRLHWPDHRVSRLDSACDLQMEFSEAQRVCQGIARECRIKGRSIVPDNPDDGATYYMGSPSSAASARVYQKSEQLRAMGSPSPGARPGIVRAEVQFRPFKQAKAAAASWSPEQVWGASPWCRRVAKELLEVDVDRIRQIARQPSTEERTRFHLCSQYGAFFLREFERLGCWAEVGEALGAYVDRLEAEKRRSVQ